MIFPYTKNSGGGEFLIGVEIANQQLTQWERTHIDCDRRPTGSAPVIPFSSFA